jgi:hypothetical protein
MNVAIFEALVEFVGSGRITGKKKDETELYSKDSIARTRV